MTIIALVFSMIRTFSSLDMGPAGKINEQDLDAVIPDKFDALADLCNMAHKER